MHIPTQSLDNLRATRAAVNLFALSLYKEKQVSHLSMAPPSLKICISSGGKGYKVKESIFASNASKFFTFFSTLSFYHNSPSSAH